MYFKTLWKSFARFYSTIISKTGWNWHPKTSIRLGWNRSCPVGPAGAYQSVSADSYKDQRTGIWGKELWIPEGIDCTIALPLIINIIQDMVLKAACRLNRTKGNLPREKCRKRRLYCSGPRQKSKELSAYCWPTSQPGRQWRKVILSF